MLPRARLSYAAAAAMLASHPLAAQILPNDLISNDIIAPVLPFGPHGTFFIKNASGADLHCAYRVAGKAWSTWFKLKNQGEFSRSGTSSGGLLEFFCKPPVVRVRYALTKNERYVLLSVSAGAVRMVRIDPVAEFMKGE